MWPTDVIAGRSEQACVLPGFAFGFPEDAHGFFEAPGAVSSVRAIEFEIGGKGPFGFDPKDPVIFGCPGMKVRTDTGSSEEVVPLPLGELDHVGDLVELKDEFGLARMEALIGDGSNHLAQRVQLIYELVRALRRMEEDQFAQALLPDAGLMLTVRLEEFNGYAASVVDPEHPRHPEAHPMVRAGEVDLPDYGHHLSGCFSNLSVLFVSKRGIEERADPIPMSNLVDGCGLSGSNHGSDIGQR